MKKIIIPSNLITTKDSVSFLNPNFSSSDYKKYKEAFSNSENEYVLDIHPKANRPIKQAALQGGTFFNIGPSGKLIMNIKNIDSYFINFKSNKLDEMDNNLNIFYQGSLLDQLDYLDCKQWEINCNNLEFQLDVDKVPSADEDSITFYKRDLLPLEELKINCNQGRIIIQNQDIKKITINNKDTSKFDLILKYLFKLEYLDISKVTRLDLCKYRQHPFEPIDNKEDEYTNSFYFSVPQDSGHINCFNIEYVNPECKIKLNSNLAFYFVLNKPTKKYDVFRSIQINNNSNNQWVVLYLANIFNCKNKSEITVKWKTLHQKLLLKINSIIKNQFENNEKEIKNYFKSKIIKEKED